MPLRAVGTGLSFDGVDDYVEVADDPSLDGFPDGVSVEVWVYPHRDISSDTHFTQKWLWISYDKSYIVSCRGDIETNKLNFGVVDQDGNISENQESGASLIGNQWNHIVLTWDLSTVKGFHNNNEIYSASFSATSLYSGDSPVQLGGNTDGDRWLDGLIDEVRIYNRALSAEEVQAL